MLDPHLDPHIAISLTGVAVCQLVGLFAAAATRWFAGSRREAACQRLFLCSFACAGLGAFVAIFAGPSWCVAAGACLAVMMLTATWDFGPRRSTSAT